jgi:hypothetical protein
MAVAEAWPLARVRAYYAWAIENDAWLAVERETLGYVGQEVEKRLKAKG